MSIYKHTSFLVTRKMVLLLVQSMLCLLCVLIYIPFLCLSQETDTITSNLSLTDPNIISSSRQVFQLGFFSPPNTTNRYLGVFYTVSPETVIWIANRDRPLNDSSGSLTIAPDGNLVITDRWNETVWSTNVTGSTFGRTTSARIEDTGNLRLQDMSTGDTIWESFMHPSNVIVAAMRMSDNTNTNTRMLMSSWRSPSDPAVGNFTAGIEASTLAQTITRNNGRPYWRSGPWNGRIFTGVEIMYSLSYLRPREQGGPAFDPQGQAIPQLSDHNGTFTFVVPEGPILMTVLLNSTGSLMFQFWNPQLRNWIAIWVAPRNDCEVYGTCGPFGNCNRYGSPICSCLTGFEPTNPGEWNMGNWTGGCARQRQLQCSLNNNTSGNEDEFLRVPYVKVPDFVVQVPSVQPAACRRRCLGNCSCTAYAHDPSMECMLWHDSLIDVMTMDGAGIDIYVRVKASELGNSQDRRLLIIILTVLGGFTMICTILISWRWMIKRKGSKAKDMEQPFTSNSTAAILKDETEIAKIEDLTMFTFETLVDATNNFDNINLLGTGGFGAVYKGTMQNGNEIAVKRLSEASRQGNDEFMNEVVVISKLQHRNLVRLLGCCVEREEKMLVYEYMPNKSLDRRLFDLTHVSKEILDWKRSSNIIGGIGRGLMYLHNDSVLKIIHRDLKPSNVLLDEDWNPKISDFGMARIFCRGEEHGSTTRAVGTYGYMAPEYAMEGQYSDKSDIYSFGVLMLEILSGKKNTHYYNRELSSGLLGCAWKMWHKKDGLAFADQAIASPSVGGDIVRCINIALLCVQEFPNDRPSIETILSMLNNEIINIPVPGEPVVLEKWNDFQIRTTHVLRQHGHSANELTITTMDGR